jgi:hypothetical protein
MSGFAGMHGGLRVLFMVESKRFGNENRT